MPAAEATPVVRPSFRVDLRATVSVLRLSGDHDTSTLRSLRLALANLIALDDRDLVVDLTGTTFLGIAPIGELEAAGRYLRLRQRRLIVLNASAVVLHAFRICGAVHLLDGAIIELPASSPGHPQRAGIVRRKGARPLVAERST